MKKEKDKRQIGRSMKDNRKDKAGKLAMRNETGDQFSEKVRDQINKQLVSSDTRKIVRLTNNQNVQK
jgi:hypothetical protein